jgi:hypothetical protein
MQPFYVIDKDFLRDWLCGERTSKSTTVTSVATAGADSDLAAALALSKISAAESMGPNTMENYFVCNDLFEK